MAFEDSGKFPLNRVDLYQRGIDCLLKKWENYKKIKRGQIYQVLSL